MEGLMAVLANQWSVRIMLNPRPPENPGAKLAYS